MKKLLTILKNIIEYLHFWVGLVGFMFVTLLCIGSVYSLKTGMAYHYDLDLGMFVANPTIAWFWIACWVAFIIQSVIWVVKNIKSGIKKINQGNTKSGLKDIFK